MVKTPSSVSPMQKDTYVSKCALQCCDIDQIVSLDIHFSELNYLQFNVMRKAVKTNLRIGSVSDMSHTDVTLLCIVNCKPK
jgi:hypothetical protein